MQTLTWPIVKVGCNHKPKKYREERKMGRRADDRSDESTATSHARADATTETENCSCSTLHCNAVSQSRRQKRRKMRRRKWAAQLNYASDEEHNKKACQTKATERRVKPKETTERRIRKRHNQKIWQTERHNKKRRVR